jgi:ankyrin repeat protein
MRHVMLLVGMGTALLAAQACAPAPTLPLAVVAARNAVATLRQLLAGGHHADERGAGGLTPLMSAARSGAVEAVTAHVAAVQVLLERGADPNLRT